MIQLSCFDVPSTMPDEVRIGVLPLLLKVRSDASDEGWSTPYEHQEPGDRRCYSSQVESGSAPSVVSRMRRKWTHADAAGEEGMWSFML